MHAIRGIMNEEWMIVGMMIFPEMLQLKETVGEWRSVCDAVGKVKNHNYSLVKIRVWNAFIHIYSHRLNSWVTFLISASSDLNRLTYSVLKST